MRTKTIQVDRTSRACDIPDGFITGWGNRKNAIVTARKGKCRVDFVVHENYVLEDGGNEWTTDDDRWTLTELEVTSASTSVSNELTSEGGFGAKRRAGQFDRFLVKALNETIATNATFRNLLTTALCEQLDNDRY